jgi:hypothetical protein
MSTTIPPTTSQSLLLKKQQQQRLSGDQQHKHDTLPVCPLCDVVFVNQARLERHMTSHQVFIVCDRLSAYVHTYRYSVNSRVRYVYVNLNMNTTYFIIGVTRVRCWRIMMVLIRLHAASCLRMN